MSVFVETDKYEVHTRRRKSQGGCPEVWAGVDDAGEQLLQGLRTQSPAHP